jgi:hypothetical protein
MARPFDVAVRDSDDASDSACQHCGQEVPGSTLDRWNWCKPCRTELNRKVRKGQYAVAALITLPFLVWILAEGTGTVLPTYAWALPLLASWYLGSRIGRVLVRNYLRSRSGV